MDMNEIYRIAHAAAKSASKQGCFMICDQDLDDMIQAAALAIWQCRSDTSEAYYFSAGKMAAWNWLIWWKYGASHTKLRYGLLEELETNLSIDWLRGYDRIERSVEDKEPLPDEIIEQLHEVFWITRRKHGPKEISGIERDTEICARLARGDSTEGIGYELGLSVHMVNNYRWLLRKRLERYIDDR